MKQPFIDVVAPVDLGVELEIDPTDPFQLEIWLGAYQPHVVSFLRACVKPGHTVLCAGLHVGYVASIARIVAGPSGFVLSAEPDAAARAAASRNLALAPRARAARIEILEGGLGRENEIIRLFESTRLGHSSFAGPHQPKSERRVAVSRGDDWLESMGVASLDVMVLDVEGWELHAVAGLERTISNSANVVALVEVSDWALNAAGSSRSDLLRALQDLGFEVRWATSYGPACALGVWGEPASSEGPARSVDVLCFKPTRA